MIEGMLDASTVVSLNLPRVTYVSELNASWQPVGIRITGGRWRIRFQVCCTFRVQLVELAGEQGNLG